MNAAYDTPKDTSRDRSCGSWPLTLTAESRMTCDPPYLSTQAKNPIDNGKRKNSTGKQQQ